MDDGESGTMHDYYVDKLQEVADFESSNFLQNEDHLRLYANEAGVIPEKINTIFNPAYISPYQISHGYS